MHSADRVLTLDDLNSELSRLEMRAGWNKKEPSLWKEPRAIFRPMHWRWTDARRGLDAAGGLISTDLADRRNLFLVNPIEGNHYATLRTLVCAYQMIMPGERARSHRHSPNALRLVLEAGENVYTVVDSERLDMAVNDVVLTPGDSWHGHAHDGAGNAYWIDFLDVPLVHLLEPMFLEGWPAGFQEPTRANESAHLVFAWKDVSRQLRSAFAADAGSTSARVVLDAPQLPTIELSMTALHPGAQSGPHLTTDNKIFAVVAGRGTSRIGAQEFSWERGDVMAIPGWLPVRHSAHEESTLFCVSDARAQRALGFYRTGRAAS